MQATTTVIYHTIALFTEKIQPLQLTSKISIS